MNQFDFVQDAFDSNYPIIVMKDCLWGLIDKDRNVLIEPKYDHIKPFINGFAAVKKDYLWGFVNEEGKEIVPPRYHFVENFTSKKIAIVSLNREYNIIDESGEEILIKNYSNIQLTSHSIVFVRDNFGFWHVYDTITQTLNKLQYIYEFWALNDHYAIKNNENYVGLLNSKSETVIECKYDSIRPLNDWLYVVYDSADNCFIFNSKDNSFNYVGHVHIESVVCVNKDYYLTYKDNKEKFRFIDTTNYMYVPNKYCDEIIENDFGTLKVQIAGKIGYLYL